MDSSDIKVEPCVVTEVKTITNFRLSIQELQLFTSVSIRVELLNAEGDLVSVRYVTIDGQYDAS